MILCDCCSKVIKVPVAKLKFCKECGKVACKSCSTYDKGKITCKECLTMKTDKMVVDDYFKDKYEEKAKGRSMMQVFILSILLLILVATNVDAVGTVEDDFTRANHATVVGTATNGNTWTQLNDAGQFGIKNNQFINNLTGIGVGAHYASLNFSTNNPTRIDFVINHTDVNNGYMYFAFGSGANPVSDDTAIHWAFSRAGTPGLWEEDRAGWRSLNYTSTTNNIWTNISIRDINYVADTYDFWVDGIQRTYSTPFEFDKDVDWITFSSNQAGLEPDFYVDNICINGECPTPSTDSGTVDVFTSNNYNGIPVNDTFMVLEDFYTFINWTNSSDVAINDSIGYCNITIENGHESLDSANIGNVTICDSVLCDYDNTYSEAFNGNDITNLIRYSPVASFCYPVTPGNENVYFSTVCGSGTTNHTISPVNIPMCSDGSLTYIANGSGVCDGDTDVTVYIESGDGQLDRVRVTDLSLGVVYSNLTHTMDYNVTNGLWYVNHSHNYQLSGTFNLYGTCVDNSTGLYNASENDTVTIYGADPLIFFNNVETECGTTTAVEGMHIEYCDGVWAWSGSIVDTDADTVNVTWYNSSGDAVQSNQGNASITLMNTSSGVFREFANPYVVVVWANDSDGNTAEKNLTFYVNDTLSPTVSVNNPIDGNNVYGTSIVVNGTCTDQSLYKFNMTVYDTNGTRFFSYEVDNLNVTSYSYQKADINFSTLRESANNTDYVLNVTVTCSDAHTAVEIGDYLVEKPTLTSVRFNDEVLISVDGVDSITAVKDFDRYTFDIASKLMSSYVYRIYADHGVTYLGDSRGYCGHLLIHRLNKPDYWFDAEGEGVVECLFAEREGYYEVTAKFADPIISVITKSLGEVNSYSDSNLMLNLPANCSVNLDICDGCRYADNIISASVNCSNGVLASTCSYSINDFASVDVVCNGSFNISAERGWNVLNFTINEGTSLEGSTVYNFWAKDYDASIFDFPVLWIMVLVMVAGFAMGTRIGAFYLVGGLAGVIVGFQLVAFSAVLGMTFAVIAPLLATLLIWKG